MVRSVCPIVCCLYCGKIIGAFRLLRDSEFCSALHRIKYRERLGKALHELATAEPPPSGVAGFLDEMPFQKGNSSSTLNPWQTVTGRNRIRTGARWPLTIDTSDAPPAAECACAEFPPRSERWMPVPAPEPVARLVTASTSLATAQTVRAPHWAAKLEPTPFLEQAWFAPVPPAEPVAAFVVTSVALTPAHAPHTPRFAAELESAPLPDATLAACNLWMTGFAATVADGAPAGTPGPAYAPRVERSEAPPRMPATEITADLEPLPRPDELLAPPPMCQSWMPAPAPDPVCSHLQASMAAAVAVAGGLKAPAFSLSATAPRVPWIGQAQPIPPAEAVMTTVLPSVAQAPLGRIRKAAAIALPAIPQVAQVRFASASPASAPAPEAVERWLVAAAAAVPVSREHAPCRALEPGAPPPVLESALKMGKPAASPAPAAVESLLVPSVAVPMAPAAAARLLPFALAVSQGRTLPTSEAQRLTLSASKPGMAAPGLAAPHPIATLAVSPPATAQRSLELALPRPGMGPFEFHSYRLRSAAAARAEWSTPRPALAPPPFLLRLMLEKPEEPAPQQKAARKEPDFIDVLNMPGVKRQPSVWIVAGKVAAGFLLAASLWFGVANFRGDRRLAAREEVSAGDAALSAADSASPARVSNGGAPVQPAAKGAVAWVRQAIAGRASLKIAENFRGMENWAGAATARPAGWSRHPDGYMHTGALALFRPSLKFADYRMEFFAQIETKSIGWTVRATDTMNYHAMKLTVVEAGIRPFVALVHYNVVGGKLGHRTQTPLNVMVHNNTPMQFAVDVHGNRVVTWIDGEEVDSFIDNTLVAGGVGFFSDAGERARLYWLSVSRNDDWLGHVCAMLAEGTGGGSTAGLRGPELPGGAPAPGLPAGRDGMTLAAMWIGLPYLGDTRKARLIKTLLETWRIEPWNT